MENLSYSDSQELDISRRDSLRIGGQSIIAATMALSCHDLLAEDKKEPTGKEFHGEGECIVVPNLEYRGNRSITLRASVRPSSIDHDMTIVGNQHNSGVALMLHDQYWEFAFHNGKQFLRARSDKKASQKSQVELMGICDGRTVRLYVDGVLQQRQSRYSGGHRPSEFPFMIGADPDGGGLPQNEFVGSIDAVRISAVHRDFNKEWMQHAFTHPDRYDALLLQFDKEKEVTDQSPLNNQLIFNETDDK